MVVEELAALLSFLLPFLSLSSTLGFTPKLLLAHTTCSVFSLGRLFFYIYIYLSILLREIAAVGSRTNRQTHIHTR